MPLTVISISALVTYELVTDKEIYQLLGLVFSPQIILNGLISAVLYRVRILLACTVVLMPFMMVNPYQEILSNARWGDCYILTKSPADYFLRMNWRPIDRRDCAWPSDNHLLQLAALEAVELTLLSWGISLFGAVLGLWSALLWRRGAFPTLVCIVVIPIILVGIITFLGPTTGKIGICTTSCTWLIPWPPLVELFSLLTPYVMAWIYALLARRLLQSDLEVSRATAPSNSPR
ncbi:MAG: hypothetical protein JXB07_04645 [Anaerolineae bacterium]|nr:hypothetical protein [Anaerolineae bacterium]